MINKNATNYISNAIENSPAKAWIIASVFLLGAPLLAGLFGYLNTFNYPFWVFNIFSGYICFIYAPTKNRGKWFWAIFGALVPIIFWFIYFLPRSKDGTF